MYFTSTLKPVTVAKELAMEAPARGSSPRWPTYMTRRPSGSRSAAARRRSAAPLAIVASSPPRTPPSSPRVGLRRGEIRRRPPSPWLSARLPFRSLVFSVFIYLSISVNVLWFVRARMRAVCHRDTQRASLELSCSFRVNIHLDLAYSLHRFAVTNPNYYYY